MPAARDVRRRSQRRLVLALSMALHALVLGWFGLRSSGGPPMAERPVMDVALVPLPRREQPRLPETRSHPTPLQARAPRLRPEAAETAPLFAPPAAASESAAPNPSDIRTAPFAGRLRMPPAPLQRPPCDPGARDDAPDAKPCRREQAIADAVTRSFDPDKGGGEFAREARRNEAVRRYNEAPGMAGYSGIACHVLHRC